MISNKTLETHWLWRAAWMTFGRDFPVHTGILSPLLAVLPMKSLTFSLLGQPFLGPLMAQFTKQLTSYLFPNNRKNNVLTAAGFFGTSAMVIQSLKIKFQGHKLPFPQTSHLTRFHKEARGELACVWRTRRGEVPTWSGLFEDEMKCRLEQTSSEKAELSSGDQGCEKVRRNLCSGHSLQA